MKDNRTEPDSPCSDPELEALLRLHPEPYHFYEDRQIHEALTLDPVAYLDFLLEGLRDIVSNRAQLELPPKAVFADPGERSDFRVMPCVIRYPDRVRKTVKIIGTNWPRKVVPGEISVGQAFALHASENFIEAGFAGCILSSARTGACAATGLRLLAPETRHLSVIGAGRVGYYSALYAASLGTIKRVSFADLDEQRAQLAARLVKSRYPDIETDTFEAADLSEAPDALILATDSETPLFHADGHHPLLVVSVGADTDWQREVRDRALEHYSVFVDTPDSVNYGDLARFIKAGILQPDSVKDLAELLKGPDRSHLPALFISTGSALFDNLTIDYLLSRHQCRSHSGLQD